MKNIKPLDDLELFEILSLAYPGKFSDDDDGFNAAQDFADEIQGIDDIADMLGRIVMLSMPMKGGLSGKLRHCLGDISIKDDQAFMIASVSREVQE